MRNCMPNSSRAFRHLATSFLSSLNVFGSRSYAKYRACVVHAPGLLSWCLNEQIHERLIPARLAKYYDRFDTHVAN